MDYGRLSAESHAERTVISPTLRSLAASTLKLVLRLVLRICGLSKLLKRWAMRVLSGISDRQSDVLRDFCQKFLGSLLQSTTRPTSPFTAGASRDNSSPFTAFSPLTAYLRPCHPWTRRFDFDDALKSSSMVSIPTSSVQFSPVQLVDEQDLATVKYSNAGTQTCNVREPLLEARHCDRCSTDPFIEVPAEYPSFLLGTERSDGSPYYSHDKHLDTRSSFNSTSVEFHFDTRSVSHDTSVSSDFACAETDARQDFEQCKKHLVSTGGHSEKFIYLSEQIECSKSKNDFASLANSRDSSANNSCLTDENSEPGDVRNSLSEDADKTNVSGCFCEGREVQQNIRHSNGQFADVETDNESLNDNDQSDEDAFTQIRYKNKTFTMQGRIGEGGHARVMVVLDELEDKYAVKVIHKPKILNSSDPLTSYTFTRAEQAALKRMAIYGESPFVTTLRYAFEDNINFYLVMDLYAGSLHDLMCQELLEPALINLYAAEIIAGMEAIHNANIFHGDIKPQNILVGLDGHLAISDFDSSISWPRHWPRGLCGSSTVRGGTAAYVAPELCPSKWDPRSSTPLWKADVWSYGMVLYEMFLGNGETFIKAESDDTWEVEVLTKEFEFKKNVPDRKARSLLKQVYHGYLSSSCWSY
ncbi:kinase-like protein [Rickenella mellea]|uniref:non-specific serine/threonine protein kinase n=1 Tax=Rickenella mellea TaxID=50990 RepID=A0A4Y7PV67_9AGAM|nr:kinase-like protein [Rickenella mellea]